ncbi:MAG: phosphotransferase family protein, partial [Chloroflexi bacterium]|nr:phosphotransferase family protein [Chloroflexota bacterium]
MATTLDRLSQWIPAWHNQPYRATPLSGGLTNQNYRVDVNGESFVVRMCGHNTELLGINRQHEYECNVIAAEVGVAPEVIAFVPELGTIVTRLVHGTKIPAEQMHTRENITRAASVVHTLHGARAFPSAWSPFRMIEEYRRTAEQLACPMPADVGEIFAHAAQVER